MYGADTARPSSRSDRDGAGPSTLTAPSNSTVTSTLHPTPHVSSAVDADTLVASVGESRIIWRPSEYATAAAYAMPPSSNAAMPRAPLSSGKRGPSVAESTPSSVPSGWMRISWTPSSTCAVTTAYATPPSLNVSTCDAPSSSGKAAPSAAQDTPSSVPFGWMRMSWTPSSPVAATIAYVLLSISKTSMPRAPLSSGKAAPSAALRTPTSRPSGPMRISWTPWLLDDATMACAVPLSSNAAMPLGLSSAPKPSGPAVWFFSRVPFG